MKLGLVKDHLRLVILKYSVMPAGVVILNGQLKLTSSIHSLLRCKFLFSCFGQCFLGTSMGLLYQLVPQKRGDDTVQRVVQDSEGIRLVL